MVSYDSVGADLAWRWIEGGVAASPDGLSRDGGFRAFGRAHANGRSDPDRGQPRHPRHGRRCGGDRHREQHLPPPGNTDHRVRLRFHNLERRRAAVGGRAQEGPPGGDADVARGGWCGARPDGRLRSGVAWVAAVAVGDPRLRTGDGGDHRRSAVQRRAAAADVAADDRPRARHRRARSRLLVALVDADPDGVPRYDAVAVRLVDAVDWSYVGRDGVGGAGLRGPGARRPAAAPLRRLVQDAPHRSHDGRSPFLPRRGQPAHRLPSRLRGPPDRSHRTVAGRGRPEGRRLVARSRPGHRPRHLHRTGRTARPLSRPDGRMGPRRGGGGPGAGLPLLGGCISPRSLDHRPAAVGLQPGPGARRRRGSQEDGTIGRSLGGRDVAGARSRPRRPGGGLRSRSVADLRDGAPQPGAGRRRAGDDRRRRPDARESPPTRR